MAALALGTAVAPRPAEAAFPGENGEIAFASNRDGDFDIYTANPDGSGLTNLTDDPARDFNPAYSPDGQKTILARGTSTRRSTPRTPRTAPTPRTSRRTPVRNRPPTGDPSPRGPRRRTRIPATPMPAPQRARTATTCSWAPPARTSSAVSAATTSWRATAGRTAFSAAEVRTPWTQWMACAATTPRTVSRDTTSASPTPGTGRRAASPTWGSTPRSKREVGAVARPRVPDGLACSVPLPRVLVSRRSESETAPASTSPVRPITARKLSLGVAPTCVGELPAVLGACAGSVRVASSSRGKGY